MTSRGLKSSPRRGAAHRTELPRNSARFPDFEHSLPMLLLKVREAVMERFRPMLKEFDLTEQQWRVIRALAEVAELDAAELAKASYILPPSLSRILRHLEERGIVRRRTSKRDGRRVMITLTAAGRRLYQSVVPVSQQHYAEIAETLSGEALGELYEILEDTHHRLTR